jgi:hypothetical protein
MLYCIALYPVVRCFPFSGVNHFNPQVMFTVSHSPFDKMGIKNHNHTDTAESLEFGQIGNQLFACIAEVMLFQI